MLEAIVGVLGVGLLGVIGWAIQLGNRVSVVESQRNDLLVLINSKFEEVYRRLDRIERHVLNGRHHEGS